jgi:O-antigen/teichoic acid export membrane protein
LLSFGLRGLLGSTYPVDTFQFDQAVIGLFMSPTSLGLYVVAVSFTNLPRFVGQSIGMVAFPSIANSLDAADGRARLRRYVFLTTALSVAIVVGVELAAGWVVPFFFGDDFDQAVSLVRILVVAAFLSAVRRVLSEGARGLGKPGIGSLGELVAWVALLPALAVFATIWGVTGVAFAMVASSIAGLIAVAVSFAPHTGGSAGGRGQEVIRDTRIRHITAATTTDDRVGG